MRIAKEQQREEIEAVFRRARQIAKDGPPTDYLLMEILARES